MRSSPAVAPVPVGLAFAVLLSSAGCGSDPCLPVSTAAPADGLLIGPDEMPTQGCEPGRLEGRDPRGLWFVTRENRAPFGGSGPVTFQGVCGEPASAQVGSIGRSFPYDTVLLDDDTWFWRQRFDLGDGDELVRAYLICAREDGVLRGHYQRCFRFQGEVECGTEPITMEPFDNLAGEKQSRGVELVSEFHGDEGATWPVAFAANVRVKDDIAYFVHGTDGLRIIDVSDLENPVELGHLPADMDFINDVKLAEGPDGTPYALIASDNVGVQVVDVSDPSAPTIVTSFTPTGVAEMGVHTLFIDTYQGSPAAFVVDGSSPVLGVWDISNPAEPVLAATYERNPDDPGFHDLFVEDGVAYINATYLGMLVVDPAASPQLLAAFPSDGEFSHSNWVTTAGGRRISVHGGEGYDAHVKIVDVDPDSASYMEQIGRYQTRAEVSVHNIMASGERAYLAHYEDGLRILDLSDPTNPEEIGHFNSWSPERSDGSYLQGIAGIDLDLERNLIFASDSNRGLLILRISDELAGN